MGNAAWVRASLAMAQPSKIAEIGAGEGVLCRSMARWQPRAEVVGVDRVQRPADFPANIGWRRGDLFEELPSCRADTVVGVMILHHFTEERLDELGGILREARTLYFCEPWRSGLARFWGNCLHPWMSEVTQHDMPASIGAGFLKGELPRWLGLGSWRVEETIDWRGSIRLRAWKE